MRRKYNLIPKLFIRRNDTVKVLSGDDRNKIGRVLAVNPRKGVAIVEGVNIIKRHVKPSERFKDGGVVSVEAPIRICKLMLIDPQTQKPTRVRKKEINGKMVRVSVKTGNPI
jgi:large subunit ribosomal protein L24